jgi:hypothetical protein
VRVSEKPPRRNPETKFLRRPARDWLASDRRAHGSHLVASPGKQSQGEMRGGASPASHFSRLQPTENFTFTLRLSFCLIIFYYFVFSLFFHGSSFPSFISHMGKTWYGRLVTRSISWGETTIGAFHWIRARTPRPEKNKNNIKFPVTTDRQPTNYNSAYLKP